MNGVLNLARELAQLGPVLPVNGKRPMWDEWQNRASKHVNGDPEWRTATGVGLLTGKRAGYFVFDVDGAAGAETLAAWERKHEKLPATWLSRTGGGGLQFFFKCPADFDVMCSASKLGPGIDIKGERGQVVAPGSRHPSGTLYTWERSPSEAQLADAPEWLLEKLRPRPAPIRAAPAPMAPRHGDEVRRARAYLAKILLEEGPAVSGEAGSTKTWNALLMAIRSFALSDADAMALAHEYSEQCVPPWSDKELRHKVDDIMDASSPPWGCLLNTTKGSGQAPGMVSAQTKRTEWPPLLRFDEVDVPPFPLDALPSWWRDLVEDVAGFAQVRPDMPAMLSLASLSTACAGRFHVEVRDGYTEPLNLFVAAVMDSGDRKSSVFRSCTQPLRDVEAEMLSRARPELAAAMLKRKNLEARLKYLQARLAKEEDDAGRLQLEADAVKAARELEALPRSITPRLLADDITPQALAILLESCGEQLGVFAPEGGIFGTLAGRYSDGQADLDLVLKAYGGEPVTVDRVTRAPVRLDHPLVTFGLTVQPRVLRDLAATPGAIELGFAGRFLYSLPASDVGGRAAAAPAMRVDGAIEFARKIRLLLKDRTPGQATHAIQMSASALAVRDSFHDEVEPRLRPGVGDLAVPGVKEWARKVVGTMARLAGILHCAQHADPVTEPVSEQTAQSAVSLCRYLIDHARAAFLTMGSDPEIERAKVALDWIRRKGCDRFTQREIFESKRKSFEDKATVLRQTLELLAEHGYIRALANDKDGPGRRSEWFEVRPDFADCAYRVPGGVAL